MPRMPFVARYVRIHGKLPLRLGAPPIYRLWCCGQLLSEVIWAAAPTRHWLGRSGSTIWCISNIQLQVLKDMGALLIPKGRTDFRIRLSWQTSNIGSEHIWMCLVTIANMKRDAERAGCIMSNLSEFLNRIDDIIPSTLSRSNLVKYPHST